MRTLPYIISVISFFLTLLVFYFISSAAIVFNFQTGEGFFLNFEITWVPLIVGGLISFLSYKLVNKWLSSHGVTISTK
ncbi:hypothetical protein GCM10008935_02380 [Alkalibacillus silvisoli]|uniref:DUF3955 domain-containing protein n=1 Tax=Alkalibacillus silvisoli TaxID=392823 RepID=A0ABN0ZKV9_9BACI